MLVQTTVATALAFAHLTVAYPHMAKFLEERNLAKKQGIPFPKIGGIPRVLPVPFDAKSQLVSVDGEHAFVAPGPNDQRGPCAGLNAAANHGYLPHDGVATYETVQTGLWEAFGLDQSECS